MQTYGYLEQPADTNEGLKAEFLYAESAIVDGVKKIQEYGGLPVTGVVDEDTIQLMRSPRCGVKDVESRRDRAKRYVIGSKNWKKRKITYL
jgi:matrix metalloproteinase-24 (membrane-inserted)